MLSERASGRASVDRFMAIVRISPPCRIRSQRALARSLSIELIQAESRRSATDRPRNPDAVDFNMRGWGKFYEGPRSKTEIAQAKDLFDSALRLDPDNVDA